MNFLGSSKQRSHPHPQVTANPAFEFHKGRCLYGKLPRGPGKMSQSESQAPEVWVDSTGLRSLPVGKPIIRPQICLNPPRRGTPCLHANLPSTLQVGAISHLCLLASKHILFHRGDPGWSWRPCGKGFTQTNCPSSPPQGSTTGRRPGPGQTGHLPLEDSCTSEHLSPQSSAMETQTQA